MVMPQSSKLLHADADDDDADAMSASVVVVAAAPWQRLITRPEIF